MGAGRVGKGGSCWRGPTEDKGFASRATPTWAPAAQENSADCTGQADKETLYYEYQGGLIEMTKNQKRDILDAIENTILFIIFLLLTPVMVCWELAKDTNKKGRYRRRQ